MIPQLVPVKLTLLVFDLDFIFGFVINTKNESEGSLSLEASKFHLKSDRILFAHPDIESIDIRIGSSLYDLNNVLGIIFCKPAMFLKKFKKESTCQEGRRDEGEKIHPWFRRFGVLLQFLKINGHFHR